MTRLFAICFAAITATVLSFSGTVWAAGALDPGSDASWLDLLRPVYDAFAGHNWIAAGCLTVIAALVLLKQNADRVSPKLAVWLHNDVVGVVLTFVLAFLGSVAAAAKGAAFSWGTFKIAGAIGIGAVGGYTVLRKLVVDHILASKWYATAPSWVKAILTLVTALGTKPPAVAAAEQAGSAAVAAAPAQGVAGVAGAPSELK